MEQKQIYSIVMEDGYFFETANLCTKEEAEAIAKRVAEERGAKIDSLVTKSERMAMAAEKLRNAVSDHAQPWDYMLHADKDIQKAYAMLEENGQTYEKQELMQVCDMADRLTEDVKKVDDAARAYMDQLEAENAKLKEEIARLQKGVNDPEYMRDIVKAVMQEMKAQTQERHSHLLSDSVNRLKERLSALKHGLAELKSGMRSDIRNLLTEARFYGKEAFRNIRMALDIQGKLTWMKNCIDNGVYEVNKTLKKVVDKASVKVENEIENKVAVAEKLKAAVPAVQGIRKETSSPLLALAEQHLRSSQKLNQMGIRALEEAYVRLCAMSDTLKTRIAALEASFPSKENIHVVDLDNEKEWGAEMG